MQEIRKLLSYTKDLKRYFVIITITSIVVALTNLITPTIMKYATDWVVGVSSGDVALTLGPLWIIVGAFIVRMLLSTAALDIGGYHGDQLAVRTRRQLSKLYFAHLLKLPQTYFDEQLTGKIINRLSRAIADATQFLQFFSNNLLQLLLTIGLTIIILAVYSWPLAVLFILLIPTNLYITAKTSGKWQKYEKQKNHHFDQASGRFTEVVSQMRLVKSFGSQKRELTSFDGQVGQMIGITAKQSRWWHGMNALRNVVFGLIFTALYGWLFYETARGVLAVGDMVLLITLIQQVVFPMNNLSYFVDSYQRAVANSRDFLEAMAETPEKESAGAKELRVKDGKVEFRDVAFGYEADDMVLRDISFEILPGQKLALVGESGGGKTTISNLLMRLYEPDSGRVIIDGTDISTVSRASLRQAIATVFQDAALFSGTVRENIAYGNPDATDEEIEQAAKAANALGFIQKFPRGLDTEIGERGIKLSGGQQQRIAIARAILKDAPILVLDEATSSLDSKAEHEVHQALERLMKGRTTLIIAHRLSTIASVDTIVTLRNGSIGEIGSPGELSKTDGIYAELLKLQLGSTEAAKKQLEKYDIAQ